MSSTRQEYRPTFIRTQSAFAEAEEELRLMEEIENSQAVANRGASNAEVNEPDSSPYHGNEMVS